MLKYSIILFVAYFLYYAGNIVYDIFLKKEKSVEVDSIEEFSLADFAQSVNHSPTPIGIDDVDNILTPKSFFKNEISVTQTLNTSEEKPDLEELRRRFESEQDIDSIADDEKLVKSIKTEAISLDNDKNKLHDESDSLIQKSNKNKWYQLLNLAETSVQMISNNGGYKIYQSIM